MDDELRRQYELYFELFGSPGWKQFAADLDQSRMDYDRVQGVKDEKELFHRQGMLHMIDTILNMPELFEQVMADSDA